MTDMIQPNRSRKYRTARVILLLLAVISSPLGCCGCAFIMDALPSSLGMPTLDLFEAEVRVENGSGETLYLTPITTTYGHPRVIVQSSSIRQRDFSLQPNDALVLTYDTADAPLAGIVVCRAENDCRLLASDRSDVYALDSFENLPELEPDWLQAVQSHPRYSFAIVVFLAFSLLPVVLFAGGLYFGRLEKKQATPLFDIDHT